MTFDEELAVLVEGVQADSGEWIDIPGQACIKLLKIIGARASVAVATVANILAMHPANSVKLHCVQLLTQADLTEAAEALANTLDLPLDDEVLEQIFEDARDVPSLKSNPRFVAKARELYLRWPDPSLRDFLQESEIAVTKS